MKPESSTQQDAALRQVLQEWKVSASLPPRFQEGVWRRIEGQEAKPAPWKLFLQRLNAALARPAFAVSYLALLLVLGLAAGYWQAAITTAHADEMLRSRYVQMVDPYLHANH